MKDSMRYIASALEPASWPQLKSPQGAPLPEIALAGRSNVGKSSFINLLAGRKNLAKVSSTPGKTQRLQFFCFEERCLLADLPGYGFAKAPAAARARWSEAIDRYFNTQSSLKLLLLLLDIRRSPSKDDFSILSFAREKKIPFLPVLTKTDMLPAAECERQRSRIIDQLGCVQPADVLMSPGSRRFFWSIISRRL